MTEQQIKQILRGFIDYKIKQGASKIIREVSPRQGYYIDNIFYSDKAIIKPFLNAYEKVKSK